MTQNQDILKQIAHKGDKPSFYQLSTGLSLIITGVVTLYFAIDVGSLWSGAIANNVIPAGYGRLVLTTIVILVVTQIILQTVLSIGAGGVAPLTSHEKLATQKATQISYTLLALILFVAIGSLLQAEPVLFFTVNLLILGFVLAEMVKYSAQLIYVRRSAEREIA